jgi:hypothetical protein
MLGLSVGSIEVKFSIGFLGNFGKWEFTLY